MFTVLILLQSDGLKTAALIFHKSGSWLCLFLKYERKVNGNHSVSSIEIISSNGYRLLTCTDRENVAKVVLKYQ